MIWFSMLAMFRFQKLATCFLVLALGTIAVPLAGRAEAEEEVNGEPISPAAQLSAASFRVEPGYRVTPVASEPLFANPVAFCFDPQGRIFVAETHRVRRGADVHVAPAHSQLARSEVGDVRGERHGPRRRARRRQRVDALRLNFEKQAMKKIKWSV